MISHLRASVVLALLLSGGVASASDRAANAELASIEEAIAASEALGANLAQDYEQRRGLIGSAEAMQRYEEAVYAFLVGEFERAAMIFFVLAEAEALAAPELRRDVQWYLAECLFELGNWASALDSYQRIINNGPSHPFFGDAVRRQLEVHGILGDTESFYMLYNAWILTGTVQPTDPVKYTIGKSFWRQGDTSRAKAAFSEIAPGGAYYARARYFLGAIMASESEFDAAAVEFRKVVEDARAPADLIELTWMALGRVHYEQGEYEAALSAYQHITARSPHFADQLHEMVWTYIKQKDWQSALEQSEIFLIAFPEHPYAFQLKLNMGHLHMKGAAYEKALAAYETVIEDYTPLHRRLLKMDRGSDDVAVYFERMVGGQDLDAGGAKLPEYARVLLTTNDEIARAVDASRILRGQLDALEDSRSVAGEVGAVLGSSNDAIGTFDRGRLGLNRVRDEALRLRVRLIRLELRLLDSAAGAGVDAEIARKTAQVETLVAQSENIQEADSASSDRYQVHDDQVRAVQSAAGRVAGVALELEAEIAATRRAWLDKKPSMSADDSQRVEGELLRLERLVKRAGETLSRLQSDATRRSVMAAVEFSRSGPSASDRAALVAEFDRVRRGLQALRSSVAGVDPAVLSRLDGLWARTLSVDARALQTRSALERAEAGELLTLRAKLSEEQSRVALMGARAEALDGDAEGVASGVTLSGFDMLEQELFDTIMKADRGIVDVYWQRKTEVSDERARLAAERAERLRELEARFGLINQKLEE